MIVRLAIALAWLVVLPLLLGVNCGFPLLARACPEAWGLPHVHLCATAYDEGPACAVADPDCSADIDPKPTRGEVCAEMVRRCE